MNRIASLNENSIKVFFNYIIPSIIGMLVVSLNIFLDAMICGHGIGSQGIAAVNLNTPVLSLLFASGFLLGAGGGTIFSIYLGEKNIQGAREVFTRTVIYGIVAGLFLILIGIVFRESICWFLGATPNTFELTLNYFTIIIACAPLLVIDITLHIYSRNDGNPKASMVATALAVATNIILNYLFVIVFSWGTSGAAAATCISTFMSTLILLINVYSKGLTNMRFVRISINKKIFFRIIKNGCSSFAMEISIGSVAVTFNNVISKQMGDIGLGAYGIITSMSIFVYSLFSGLAQGLQPILSINFGADKMKRVFTFQRYAYIVGIIIGAIFFTTGLIFSDSLAQLFIKGEPAVSEMVANMIPIMFPIFLFMGFNIVVATFFQSLEMGLRAFLIMIMRGMILPILCVVVMKNFGENGIWASQPIAEFLSIILSVLFLLFYKRNRERLITVEK